MRQWKIGLNWHAMSQDYFDFIYKKNGGLKLISICFE